MSDELVLLGVTGGIGSGKSVVCNVYRALGVPVYDADQRAKWLVAHDQSLKKAIRDEFGEESYQDGKLNRDHLARAFHDPERLQTLNELVHPVVYKDFNDWIETQNRPMLIKEAALLYETDSYLGLDKTILVVAPTEVRVERVLSRDPFRTKDEIHQIMDRQWSDAKKEPLADYVLHNDGHTAILPEIISIHEELVNL